MWKRILVCLVFATAISAQEGHPLSGTWTGDWGPDATPRNHVTLVMNWDGEKVSGVINPGPDAAPLLNVYVDYSKWTVRFDADGKDSTGKAVRIEGEGRIEDLGSSQRKLIGTWRQGQTAGQFKVTRQP